MIIIEFLWDVLREACYYIPRFIIWIITARDCKHCKYREELYCSYYDDKWTCSCNRIFSNAEEQKFYESCMSTPWRCNFKRKKKEKVSRDG